MFCDLVAPPHCLPNLIPKSCASGASYQQRKCRIIGRYAGHIAQYLGDGLLVYFGYPQRTRMTRSERCEQPWRSSRPSAPERTTPGQRRGAAIPLPHQLPVLPPLQLSHRYSHRVSGRRRNGRGGQSANCWPWARRPTLPPGYREKPSPIR